MQTWLSLSPVPCPIAFVVKNGWNTLAATCWGHGGAGVGHGYRNIFPLTQPRGAMPVRNSYIPRSNRQPTTFGIASRLLIAKFRGLMQQPPPTEICRRAEASASLFRLPNSDLGRRRCRE